MRNLFEEIIGDPVVIAERNPIVDLDSPSDRVHVDLHFSPATAKKCRLYRQLWLQFDRREITGSFSFSLFLSLSLSLSSLLFVCEGRQEGSELSENSKLRRFGEDKMFLLFLSKDVDTMTLSY